MLTWLPADPIGPKRRMTAIRGDTFRFGAGTFSGLVKYAAREDRKSSRPLAVSLKEGAVDANFAKLPELLRWSR